MSTWLAHLALAHRHYTPYHHHEQTGSDFEKEERDHMARIRRKSAASHHASRTLSVVCAISAVMVLLWGLYYINGKAVSLEITKQSSRSNLRVRNQWISSEAQAFVSLLAVWTDCRDMRFCDFTLSKFKTLTRIYYCSK